MSYSVVLFVTLFVLLVSWTVFWSKKKYSHFKERNVPFRKPIFPLGNLREITAPQKSLINWFKEFYFEYKDKNPFSGFFIGMEPIVMVTDLDVAKRILTTNFSQFTDRVFYTNERDDPLSAMLVSMEGERWRNMRTKLSATFSNHNVRKMFESVHEIGDNMVNYVDVNFVQKDQPFNVKYLSMRFICDSIGCCGFGLDCGALSDRDPILLKMSEELFPYTRLKVAFWFLTSVYKKTANFFRVRVFPKHVTETFRDLINETVKYREENNVVRNDFMQLLIQIKNKGCLVEDESGEELQKTSYEELQAQAFVIFFAGFHSSRMTLAFALFELAANSSIQERLREELMGKVSGGGRLTYESLDEMVYLEQVLNETMRKYPPQSGISRAATTDTIIPGTDYQIKKGQQLYIPIAGIHYDPEIYPDPDRFDPDRMTQQKIKERHSCSYLPLGAGPRICFGYKFGFLQVKLGIAKILMNYQLSVNSKTKQPFDFHPHRFDFDVLSGVWLHAQPLNQL